jgi:hypothetical protein
MFLLHKYDKFSAIWESEREIPHSINAHPDLSLYFQAVYDIWPSQSSKPWQIAYIELKSFQWHASISKNGFYIWSKFRNFLKLLTVTHAKCPQPNKSFNACRKANNITFGEIWFWYQKYCLNLYKLWYAACIK